MYGHPAVAPADDRMLTYAGIIIGSAAAKQTRNGATNVDNAELYMYSTTGVSRLHDHTVFIGTYPLSLCYRSRLSVTFLTAPMTAEHPCPQSYVNTTSRKTRRQVFIGCQPYHQSACRAIAVVVFAFHRLE